MVLCEEVELGVLCVDVLETLETLEEVEDVATTELLLLETADRLYNSNLFPAPQYSYLFPGQVNEQSVCLFARPDPVPSILPQ